ncbi:MAG: glutaredoxin [Solobacterium sp.]|nr:glutaredoxin [Solobacterium sp.]
MKIYGSEMCPDCVACKKNFDHYGIEYDFIDINLSLRDLKQFLIYRDHDHVFNHCKEINDIGLPALVMDDDSISLDWEGLLKEKGLTILEEEETVEACSLDRKGC